MSFKATVSIDGGTPVNLLDCSFSLHRDTDPTGRPSSGLYGGTIEFEIESTDDTSVIEWMSDPYKMKGGSVIFNKRDEDAKMKELKFEDAYVTQYTEGFHSVGENPMKINFTVSAKKITLGNATHENEWPG